MAQSELLWALVADGELEDIKKLNFEDFDWTSCHPTCGKTLVVLAIQSGMTGRHQEALWKLEWLIHQGASITQKCTGGTFNLFDKTDKEATKITVECKDLSGITFVEAWRGKLKEKNPWPTTYIYLAQVWKAFASCTARSQSSENYRPKVTIDEGIAELWEKFLSAKTSHDLTIETADGKVTAHAQMLKEASPVVRAMLESPMKEGQGQRIEVNDTSSGGVLLFLEILGDANSEFLSIFPWKFLMQT